MHTTQRKNKIFTEGNLYCHTQQLGKDHHKKYTLMHESSLNGILKQLA